MKSLPLPVSQFLSQFHYMQPNGTQRNKSSSRKNRYTEVLDARKQRIKRLCQRNGRFYARLWMEQADGSKKDEWFPLNGVTVPEARAELEELLVKRRKGQLEHQKASKKLADYVPIYLERVKATKAKATWERETGCLKVWCEEMGRLRMDKIRTRHIVAVRDKRMAAGLMNRSLNVDLIALRNCLKSAKQDGELTVSPANDIGWLKTSTVKRNLFTSHNIDRLCEAAFGTKQNAKGENVPVTKNARQVVDYIRLMQYCGARRNETLRLKWSDVDWGNQQLAIGSDGLSKNGKPRHVDFNPNLELHLKAMLERRAPDSQWLFPSPQRGEKDIPAKTLWPSVEMIREHAELPTFGCHDCRHHFISMCVMAGIDFMTIAKWVGHVDGGVLIGKVYGHLAEGHGRLMAKKVVFGPTVVRAMACGETE